jgi:hypothetical protein
MSFQHAAPRVLFRALALSAVAGGFVTAGCGPLSGESAPSAKQHLQSALATEAEKNPQVIPGRMRKLGKGVVGPKNIKQRLLNTQPES